MQIRQFFFICTSTRGQSAVTSALLWERFPVPWSVVLGAQLPALQFKRVPVWLLLVRGNSDCVPLAVSGFAVARVVARENQYVHSAVLVNARSNSSGSLCVFPPVHVTRETITMEHIGWHRCPKKTLRCLYAKICITKFGNSKNQTQKPKTKNPKAKTKKPPPNPNPNPKPNPKPKPKANTKPRPKPSYLSRIGKTKPTHFPVYSSAYKHGNAFVVHDPISWLFWLLFFEKRSKRGFFSLESRLSIFFSLTTFFYNCR